MHSIELEDQEDNLSTSTTPHKKNCATLNEKSTMSEDQNYEWAITNKENQS